MESLSHKQDGSWVFYPNSFTKTLSKLSLLRHITFDLILPNYFQPLTHFLTTTSCTSNTFIPILYPFQILLKFATHSYQSINLLKLPHLPFLASMFHHYHHILANILISVILHSSLPSLYSLGKVSSPIKSN